jgi:25S rRNA (uracil2634-N3)-methyltransferase
MYNIGDFSFARSLFEHHRCKKVFATCYDSQDTLLEKYHGQAESNIKKFLDVDEEHGNAKTDLAIDSEKPEQEEEKVEDTKRKNNTRKVLYSVDAKKLGSNVGGGKDIRKGIPITKRKTQDLPWNKSKESPSKGNEREDDGGPWDIISFNFPHVGGLSTDVNRQVRANQELLVSFFKACVPLLSRQGQSDEDSKDNFENDDEYPTDSEEDSESEDEPEDNQQIRTVPRHSGQIIVTLFEGEPYTLWNIKDLARHAGLVVVTSFRFPWKSYPGYSHARTLGVVESRKNRHDNDDDDDHQKKSGGAWKGEDRDARSYVFEVKNIQQRGSKGDKKKKKRGSDDESSDGE